MQNVSAQYKAAMAQLQRNRSYAEIVLEVVDGKATADASPSDNGHAPFSNVAVAVGVKRLSKLYATMEYDRMAVDGSEYVVPDSSAYEPQGYCSDAVSGDDGKFEHWYPNSSSEFMAGTADNGEAEPLADGALMGLKMQAGAAVKNPSWASVKGGRNLIIGSSIVSIGAQWAQSGWNQGLSVDGVQYVLTGISGWVNARYKLPDQYIGKTITLSFDIKCDESTTDNSSFLSTYNDDYSNGYAFKNIVYQQSSDGHSWKHITYTGTLNDSGYIGFISETSVERTGLRSIYRIKNLKVESGSVATDWSPAPEDLTPDNITNYEGVASLLTITGSFAEGDMITYDGTAAYKNGVPVSHAGNLVAYQGGTIITGSDYGTVGYRYYPDANNPVVGISFSKLYNILGFTVIFDTTENLYSTDFIVRTYNGDTLLKTFAVTGNTKTEYMIDTPLNEFNRIEVEFVKTSQAHNRVHVFGFAMGLIKTFTNDNFVDDGIEQDMAVDPVSSELPTAELGFSIDNYSGEYNPDNPSNVYACLQQEQAVTLSYGYDIGNGSVEWLPGGRYYLTDWNAPANSQSATFKAKSLLEFMQQTYTKGVYSPSGATLYDLAEDVLLDAGLPKAPDGSDQWALDDSLKNIKTVAPLPAKPQRELLQLIANAGMCVLSVGRDGKIRIAPAPEEQTDYNLGFNEAMVYPEDALTPPLREVDVKVYSFLPDAAASSIYSGTVTVFGTQTVHIDYSGSPAAGVSAAVTGGTLVSAVYYTYSCDLTITAAGAVTVAISGYKLNSTSGTASYIKNSSGEVCPVDNPIITDPANAADVAQWIAGYLGLRRTYTEDYRGEPALDAGDNITMQTQYTASLPARILQNVVKFSGGLSGSVTLKGVS